VKDIRHNGMFETIIAADDGSILDGWHRYRACLQAGITPRIELFRNMLEPAAEEAGRTMSEVEFVVARNARRRHLTQARKREIVAALLKAEPQKSNVAIAKSANVTDKTVAAVRSTLEATSEIPRLTKTTGRDGKARKVKPAKPAPKPRAPPPPGPRGPGSRNVVMVDGVEVLDPGRPLRPNVKPAPKERPFVVDAVPRVVPEDLMPSLPVDMAQAMTPADAEAARILRQIAALDPSGLSDADSFADDLLAASRRFITTPRGALQ
jgi:plasmid stability protein